MSTFEGLPILNPSPRSARTATVLARHCVRDADGQVLQLLQADILPHESTFDALARHGLRVGWLEIAGDDSRH